MYEGEEAEWAMVAKDAEINRLRKALEWYESCAYIMAWDYLEKRRTTALQKLCVDGGKRSGRHKVMIDPSNADKGHRVVVTDE